MSILPMLRAAEIVRVLLRAGFKVARSKGSHMRLEHTGDPTRIATIPIHAKDISRAILSSILRQAKLTSEEFLKLLRK